MAGIQATRRRRRTSRQRRRSSQNHRRLALFRYAESVRSALQRSPLYSRPHFTRKKCHPDVLRHRPKPPSRTLNSPRIPSPSPCSLLSYSANSAPPPLRLCDNRFLHCLNSLVPFSQICAALHRPLTLTCHHFSPLTLRVRVCTYKPCEKQMTNFLDSLNPEQRLAAET